MKFPKKFLWGISMSAFQYEMGISKEAVDSHSDWYVWLHNEENRAKKIVSGDVPEQGPGYWDLYKTDHDWAEWIRLNTWRINPEWSRIFPNSTEKIKVYINSNNDEIIDVDISEGDLKKLDSIANQSSVKKYEEIFKDIKYRGLTLIINLYHWTLPLWIHDPIKVRNSNLKEGPKGWLEEKTIIEFTKFAAYIAWKFGDLVDMWSTMNEPNVVWLNGYLGENFPPGINSFEASAKVAYNLMQAHARAYDQIKRLIGKKAKVGIIYAVSPSEPLTNSEDDVKAAKKLNDISINWFFNAIIKGIVKKNFIQEEIKREDIKDKADWIGINYYSRNVVKSKNDSPGWETVNGYGFLCRDMKKSKAELPVSDFGWEIYPEGIRKALNLFKDYERTLIITENGIADRKDRNRAWYIVSHLYQINKAINENNINVIGYLHWSLIDNLEWASGFDKKFGLIYVDMKSKKRYPRPSAYIYRDIISANEVPEYLFEYSKYPNVLT
jgi:beta-galactosidase